MDQAKYAPCPACQAPIPVGHKFCGRCGATTPAAQLTVVTEYFGELQDPGKASLVVVRGSGQDGLSYHLRATEHLLGTHGQIQLADAFVSRRHANLFYRGAALILRDEQSASGTYVRVRGKAKIGLGDSLLVGDQLVRVEPMPTIRDDPDVTGTYFYASPTFASPYRLVQVLEGGAAGLALCPRTTRATIGRQGCDLNFFDDTHVSLEHCVIEQDEDGFSVTDLDSKNGTYVRLKGERALDHGDYFAVGRHVMRVEFNA
jgi:hypothetical protein